MRGFETISVDPLTPVIGAEIRGVDFSQPLPAEQFAEIRAAFISHHVLVFRDQHLSPESHKRFARLFDPLAARRQTSRDSSPS